MGRWVLQHRAPVVLVRGRAAGQTLRRYGMKPMWSTSGHGRVLDDQLLGDIVAIAGEATLGVRVQHADGSDCTCCSLRASGRELDADPSEDACTGGVS